MQKWQYKVWDYAPSKEDPLFSCEERLNKQIAPDGWELVAVVQLDDVSRHYFKRAIDIPPNPG